MRNEASVSPEYTEHKPMPHYLQPCPDSENFDCNLSARSRCSCGHYSTSEAFTSRKLLAMLAEPS